MPDGTITGAQLVKTENYVMITGLIQQTNINIADGDFGGELDPGGQDLVCGLLSLMRKLTHLLIQRGNPIGGLMYSTAFNSSAYQVNNWVKCA